MEIEDYERATREWGSRNPGFIKPSVLNKKVKDMKTPVVTNVEGYKCSFCDREFEKLHGKQVHQIQCNKNPCAINRAGWTKKPRGAPKGNQYARKQPVETIQHKTETMAGVGETAVFHAFTPPTAQDHDTFNEDLYRLKAPSASPVSSLPLPARATFSVSRLYDYLLAGILLAILLCGIIYAALGIKLLIGW